MAWGVLGDQKKKSGKCHELSRNQYKKKVDQFHSGGGGVPRGIGGGGKMSKVREIS